MPQTKSKQKPTRRLRALRLGSLLCAALLLALILPASAGAETAAEKYKRLKGELETISGQIESYENDKSASQEKKAALEEQKRVVDELIAVNKEDIAATETALAAKEAEAAEKRAELYANDQLYRERLEAIYRMNNSNALTSLLAVDSFSELLVVADALQRISEHDTEVLNTLARQRAELEAEQEEIDAMLAELQEKYDNLAADAQVLAGNIQATNSHISDVEAAIAAQEQAYNETHAALEQAQKEMAAIASRMGGSSYGDGSQYVGGVFIWPVPGYYNISCHFGSADPNGAPHRGMDISGMRQTGQPIVACGDGTVITATYAHSSYGNYVIIDHGNGVKTLYAHCESLTVSAGQAVSQGDQIATLGSTGFSTGPHLHLEVHAQGGLQNPEGYLRG